jgi:protein arginine N-methyltransferase 1
MAETTYSIVSYGRMLADRTRLEPYAAALRALVRPGSVVVDIGTGTGFFAILAAKLGARKVYGIDPTDLVRTARELAAENCVADRVEFIQDVSTRVELPERADVIVSDLRSILPPFQGIVATMVDARTRLLAPGGALVPRMDVLMAAPVEAPRLWDDIAGPAEVMGVTLGAARRVATHHWLRDLFQPGQMLGEAQEWARMDYRTMTVADVSGAAEWAAARAGTAHGLGVWFRADLAEGIGFDTGPGHTSIYQTAFFPFTEPVAVAPGDRIRAELQARHLGGEYLWFWNTTVERAGSPPVSFRQSTFFASTPSLDRLRKRADAFVPRLRGDGQVAAFVLARMDGGAALGQIAREVMERFPGRFDSWEAALARVGAVSEQYAE